MVDYYRVLKYICDWDLQHEIASVQSSMKDRTRWRPGECLNTVGSVCENAREKCVAAENTVK